MDASAVRAERQALLALRRARGLTYEDLSEMTGLSPATFKWWERRLRAQPRPGRAKRPGPSRFAEVHVRGGDVAWAFEVELRGGRRVRVAAGFDESALRRLLGVLESAC